MASTRSLTESTVRLGKQFNDATTRGLKRGFLFSPPRILPADNSPKMIFKHYRELVTDEAAKKWFLIAPAKENAIHPDGRATLIL
jgi:hypothetical protein